MSRRELRLALLFALLLFALAPRPARASCRDGALVLLGFAMPGLISNIAFAIYDFAAWDRPDRGVAIAEVASQAPIVAFHTITLPIAIAMSVKNKNQSNPWCWPLVEFAFWAPSVALLAHGSWVLANPPPESSLIAPTMAGLSSPLATHAALPGLVPLLTVRPR